MLLPADAFDTLRRSLSGQPMAGCIEGATEHSGNGACQVIPLAEWPSASFDTEKGNAMPCADLLHALDHVLPAEDILYHFTSLTTGMEKILPNRSLRFAPLDGTNDPLEFEDIIHVGIDLGFGEESYEALKLGDRVKEIRRRTLLACFCSEKYDPKDPTTPFAKGWKRARMWAQYAEKHRGLCLVFHKNRLEAAVKAALPDHWKPLPDFVRYREEYVLGTSIMESTTLRPGDAAKETPQARLIREAKSLLFSKFLDFRDEREWRMALVPETPMAEREIFVPVLDSLHAVILGTKFPEVYETTVLETATCPVFRVQWFHGKAELTQLDHSRGNSP